MMSVSAEPDFYKDVLKCLETFDVKDKNCNLVFDSMTIRKQIIWDPNTRKYKGYCDFGNGINLQRESEKATEVLVFFLVHISVTDGSGQSLTFL